MTRYMIERTWDPEKENKASVEAGLRSKRLVIEKFPDVTWEHSHVVMNEVGLLKTFCVYEAPSEAVVREHASLLGNHEISAIYEIGGDISPSDFPT
jgi:hypothetical protein